MNDNSSKGKILNIQLAFFFLKKQAYKTKKNH